MLFFLILIKEKENVISLNNLEKSYNSDPIDVNENFKILIVHLSNENKNGFIIIDILIIWPKI